MPRTSPALGVQRREMRERIRFASLDRWALNASISSCVYHKSSRWDPNVRLVTMAISLVGEKVTDLHNAMVEWILGGVDSGAALNAFVRVQKIVRIVSSNECYGG